MRQAPSTLRDLLASVVVAMGYEFVGCELQSQGRSALLRIYIDKENGIALDDCSKVSRQVSAILDVEDPLPGKYMLEVSSPGLDRPLFEMAHFEKYVGKEVKIRLQAPMDNRRNLAGTLLRTEGMNIFLQVDQDEIMVPFSAIEKAKLINVG